MKRSITDPFCEELSGGSENLPRWSSACYPFFQRMERGMRVDPHTGLLVRDTGFMTNYLPVPVQAGDRILPRSPDIPYVCAFYSEDIPDALIYTYSYAPESNWTTFCAQHSDFQWSGRGREMPRSGFVRLTVRISDPCETAPRFHDLFSVAGDEWGACSVPFWMQEEALHTAERVRQIRKPGDAVFLLLADTHYASGSIWSDTCESLRLVSETIRPDGLIHLGDFTDGLLPRRHTVGLSAGILADLRSICSSVHVCIGNHDMNYFRGNPDAMSKKACAWLYLGRRNPWYYVDLPEKKTRLLFLDSFSPEEQERYGFSGHQVSWLRRVLRFTPGDYKLLVFSHVPPLPEIHVWSSVIRNGEKTLRLLERHHARHPGSVLGWIHGHNHADQVWSARAFPIVGIGCGKLESFQEHKPDGSVTWFRKKGERTQELWDVLVIRPEEGRLGFVRFGAGEDRFTANRQHDEEPDE